MVKNKIESFEDVEERFKMVEEYTNYLAEKLNQSVKYSEFIAEHMNKMSDEIDELKVTNSRYKKIIQLYR